MVYLGVFWRSMFISSSYIFDGVSLSVLDQGGLQYFIFLNTFIQFREWIWPGSTWLAETSANKVQEQTSVYGLVWPQKKQKAWWRSERLSEWVTEWDSLQELFSFFWLHKQKSEIVFHVVLTRNVMTLMLKWPTMYKNGNTF